jgi:predicted nuclease of predicted toxin-antitoxin system
MLLFDENIAARVTELVYSDFPGSVHVRDVGLTASSDDTLWHWAKEQGLAIISKDDDSLSRALLLGHLRK